MAWKDFSDESEYSEDKISKYNPAALMMLSLHQISDLMDLCKLAPDKINVDYQEYGYVLWVRSINNLFFHIKSKAGKEEKKNIHLIKDKIEDMMIKFPIMEEKKTMDGVKTVWNDKRWIIFKKYLEDYESMVKECADAHGYATPLKDESSLF